MRMPRLSAAGCEIREKIKDTNLILTTKEAKHALRCKGPSDKRLQVILNTNCKETAATDREQRWMAGYILSMSGYKIEE